MGKARVWILAALAMAASALSACNVVSTKTPMFGPQDASSLKLRDGVWRQAPDPDKACKFDETKPVDTWPECVDPLLVRGGEFFPWRGESKSWNPEGAGKALLVAGEPMIMQFRDERSDGGIYLYAGFEPKLDAEGRVIKIDAWPVLCGPPPPPAQGQTANANDATSAGTKAPFPGMVMDEKGQNCTTSDPGAIRYSAKASRALVKGAVPFIYWVRDGEK